MAMERISIKALRGLMREIDGAIDEAARDAVARCSIEKPREVVVRVKIKPKHHADANQVVPTISYEVTMKKPQKTHPAIIGYVNRAGDMMVDPETLDARQMDVTDVIPENVQTIKPTPANVGM